MKYLILGFCTGILFWRWFSQLLDEYEAAEEELHQTGGLTLTPNMLGGGGMPFTPAWVGRIPPDSSVCKREVLGAFPSEKPQGVTTRTDLRVCSKCRQPVLLCSCDNARHYGSTYCTRCGNPHRRCCCDR